MLCSASSVGNEWSTFFKKMGNPRPLFVYFQSFQTNINTILQQINVKKCPSSIQHWDSNPRPSERESPPITTRPGLPPKITKMLRFGQFNEKY